MNWVTVVWSLVSGACLTLALMHLAIWCRDRSSPASFWFFIAVLGVVGEAACELVMMNTDVPQVYAAAIRFGHLSFFFVFSGLLGFIHGYFGTGRLPLLWTAFALRVLAILANFTTGQSLHVVEVRSLEKIRFLGESVTILGEWVPNRWMILGQLSTLVLLIYLLDAAWRLWRFGTGEGRRRAMVLGGSLTFFIVFASVQSALVGFGVIRLPFFVSIPVLGIVLAMGFELSRDVLRAGRLSNDLTTSRQRLRQVVAAANVALWEWDMRTDRIWISDEGKSLYGIDPRAELDFARFSSLLHPHDRDSLRESAVRAAAGPEPFAAEYRVVFPDGEIRWIAAEGRIERDGKGKAVVLRGVSLDVTERQRAHQESALQQQELAYLSRISHLGELAGALAHELNQPLAAILGNAQVGRCSLKDPAPDLVEMAAILDDIATDAKRAGGIIHGMRAMFKKEPSGMVLSVDPNEVVTQVLHLLHGELLARKASIQTFLEPALEPVAAGRVEVQQILINLVMNALDAMKGGAENLLEIHTRRVQARIEIVVRDHGPGIPPEFELTLFEPFVSSKSGGLGLGLAISRSIARRFQGELRASNHPGGGAVFELWLPVAAEVGPSAAENSC